MSQSDARCYFIAKHDLGAFEALPNFVWKTKPSDKVPRGFNQIQVGDLWVAFAYVTSDPSEERLSQITGFFECIKTRRYEVIPPFSDKARPPYVAPYESGKAWLIEGKEHGRQPDQPVDVPPINKLLGKQMYERATLIRITAEDFEKLQTETFEREKTQRKVPLIGRSPMCEQELLCAVVFGHKGLGIERIIRVQKGFPDLLVRIEGVPNEVHLELEMYASGFYSHGHQDKVKDGKFKGEDGKFEGPEVGVLCWVDDDDDDQVKGCVHDRVYALDALLRKDERIRWR